MTNDRFSRFLLSVIALSLAVIALRGVIPDAIAAPGDMKCEIVGTVNVAGKIAIDTYNTPISIKSTDELQVRVRDTVPVKMDRLDTVNVRVERIDSTVQIHQN